MKKINKLIAVLLIFLCSCLDGGGRKGRPLIDKFNEIEPEAIVELCTQAYSVPDQSCLGSCPTGTHIADSTEITAAKSDADKNANLTLAEQDLLKQNIDSASSVCVLGSGVLRPDGEIYVKNDFCICSKGKAENLNLCEAFCQNKTQSESKLYGSVTVGPNILLNPDLGDLGNWCLTEITGSDFTSPKCTIEFNDGINTTSVDATVSKGSNFFSADVTATSIVNYKTTYIATIIATAAEARVKSTSFQIYRVKPTDPDNKPTGPLKIMPISQYTCINKSYTTDSNNTNLNYWNFAARIHYYYPSNNAPPAMPPFTPGETYYACHDVNQHGMYDNPLFDRLENIPQHFSLWDLSDQRFADLDKDQKPDINKDIEDQLLADFNEVRQVNLFALFAFTTNYPLSTSAQKMGYYMQAWIDSNGRAFCPGQSEYNSSDNLFGILKELVGVDTEGLFVAEREPVILSDQQGNMVAAPPDRMWIRENLLNKIWFYMENNQHYVPDEVTTGSKTLRFYWPADVNDPYVKKSDQKTYTVRRFEEIITGESTTLDQLTTHDKRHGCIPSLD